MTFDDKAPPVCPILKSIIKGLMIMKKLIKNLIVAATLPALNVGDVILGGKFKNKRMVIKGFGFDGNGQPTVKTDKGTKPVFNFRVEKLMKK